MTRFRSVKNFWTDTEHNATKMAVKSPAEPRPFMINDCSSDFGSICNIRKTRVDIEALMRGSCFHRWPRSYPMAKHTKTARSPKVAVMGTFNSVSPGTRCLLINAVALFMGDLPGHGDFVHEHGGYRLRFAHAASAARFS